MEATPVRISHRFSPKFTGTKNFNNSRGGKTVCCLQLHHLSFAQTYESLGINCSGFSGGPFVVLNEPLPRKAKRRFCLYVSNELQGDYISAGATSSESQNPELLRQKMMTRHIHQVHIRIQITLTLFSRSLEGLKIDS